MCVHEEYKTSAQKPLGLFPRSESSFSVSSQTEVSALQVIWSILKTGSRGRSVDSHLTLDDSR